MLEYWHPALVTAIPVLAGHQLITKAKLLCNQLWPEYDIDIGAQYYLQNFYTQHGFKRISKPYLEDNIEHVDMRWSHKSE
ncbi:GNAT family N-acetyltransferase [Cardiobacteriaceae bacterium TAE3-ERU3]|nr:GNAT family N-acetyltransferase [Cardiobacteriaceae bacterium TAE3-ERU3]